VHARPRPATPPARLRARPQIPQHAGRAEQRLDTIQAAILIEKLAIFEDEITARGRIAARYAAGLEAPPPGGDGDCGRSRPGPSNTIEHRDRDGWPRT